MKRALILASLIVFSCECPALVTWKNSVGDWDVPMTFDLSACDLTEPFETVLIESEDGQLIFGENQTVSRADYLKKVNDAMPRDPDSGHPLAKVRVSKDGRQFILKAGHRGSVIILR